MSASALYDVQGPRAVRRHRIGGVVAVLALGGLLYLVVLELDERGQLTNATWEFLTVSGTWQAILDGLRNTLAVAAVAIVLALAFGGVFAIGKLSERRWLRWPATIVVEFFRAVPLLLLILFIFLGFGEQLGRFWSLALALMLYSGSVLAEILRAGIQAVPRGQLEAGYAVGLRKSQVMRLVVLPQAVRIMLPAIISQSVIVLKDTSLGLVIAYDELARAGRQIFVFYNNPLAVGLVIAAIYIAINYLLSRVAVTLEARQRRVRTPEQVDILVEAR